jgi:methionine-gamma-lyase
MALKKLDEARYHIPTRLIYGKSFTEAWDYSHHVIPPMTASSTFRLDSSARGAEAFGALGKSSDGRADPMYVYDRMGEPNNLMLEHALAIAEQTECGFTFASGMAAVQAAVTFMLEKGSEVISHATVYGCTYSLFTDWFPRFGFKAHFCNLVKPDAFVPLLTDNTRVLYLESPANPTLEMLDLEAIMKVVRKVNEGRPADRKIITVIDNTFSTPWCQRPASFGVDVVVHSLTKGICGFGTHMGGVVLTRKEFHERLFKIRKDFGGTMSPQTAWHILIYGVPTLGLRIPRQQENAIKIARFLEEHPLVEKVRYPGLPSFPQYEVAQRMLRDYDGNFAPGFMVYFALKGKTPEESQRRGACMMDFIAQNAYAVTLAVSLGQLRTLIEHPGSTTHVAYPAAEQLKAGIDPGGIRLAVGIEHPDDIIADLKAGLEAVKA